MPKWKANGWRRKERGQLKPVIERGPLATDRRAASPAHDVRVEHVLGHRGHPENEAVDRMAVAAIKALRESQRSSTPRLIACSDPPRNVGRRRADPPSGDAGRSP